MRSGPAPTNGGPHLRHRCVGKPEVTARAHSVGDEEQQKKRIDGEVRFEAHGKK